MQCESGRRNSAGVFTTGLYRGKTPTYRHSVDAVVKILQRDGIGGFYAGVVPTVIRAVSLTTGLLVSCAPMHSKLRVCCPASHLPVI